MAKKFSYCEKCGQKTMVYRRNIRKGMIYALIQLWKMGPARSSELNLPIGINADFSKLKFWGLIYKPDKEDREKWQITNKGKDFLTNLIRLPKYVFIFNNRIMERSEETIGLTEIYPEKVDFERIVKEARALKLPKRYNETFEYEK